MAKKASSKKKASKKVRPTDKVVPLSFRTKIWRNLSREKAELKIAEIMRDPMYVTHKLLVQSADLFTVVGVFRKE